MPTRNRGASTDRRLLLFVGRFFSFAALTVSSALCAALEQRMKIQDRSDKGSPIQISGHMKLATTAGISFPILSSTASQ